MSLSQKDQRNAPHLRVLETAVYRAISYEGNPVEEIEICRFPFSSQHESNIQSCHPKTPYSSVETTIHVLDKLMHT